MPSPKKSSFIVTPDTIAQSVENATRGRENYDRDERITARKADMLQRRQADLDILMDTHDDLLREAFQLDKFVTLLSYDPKVAKNDNSQVFLEYKEPHDLLYKTANSSGSGNSTRKTRRATIEFRESFTSTISAGPSIQPSTVTPSKGKGRARISSGLDPASPLGNTIGRARMQARDVLPSSIPKGKGKAKELLHASSPSVQVMPPPSPALAPLRRDHHSRRIKDAPWRNKSEVSEPSTASSITISRGLARMGFSSSPSSQLSLDRLGRTRRSASGVKRDPIAAHIEPASGGTKHSVPHVPPIPPKQTIKRIRLFQRPRPAVYTHASQLPPRPLHRNSIVDFLNSFVSLEDSLDMTHDELERLSLAEAKTRSRIRDLRRQGRLLLNIPELPDGSIGISSLGAPHDGETSELARKENHYDCLVSAASRRGLFIAAEYATKRAMAKKVAKLVMGWHGTKENTMEKQRKVEALRIKALAKLTIKEVEKQWKKAVMAVRDHHRAIFEAEEARIGRKHLDAILDQSGAILEAQHTDLSRARSRSSSARDWSDSDESDGDGDHGEDVEDDVGSEISGEHTSDGKVDEVDATWLLGTDVQGSRCPSSDLEDGSAIPETDGTRSRGSHGGETSLSHSEGSPDALPMIEAGGISFSRTPSDVAPDQPSTGAKTVPPTFSIADTATMLGSKGSEVPDGDDVSEEHSIMLTDIDPTVRIPVEDEATDNLSSSYLRRKGYRNSRPSSPVFQACDTSITPSPIHSGASPQSHPQLSPTPDKANISSTHADEYINPLGKKGDSRLEVNGHKVVAVRLSNGVVIYREIGTSSSLEESSGVVSLGEATEVDGRQTKYSLANEDLMEPTSSTEITREHSPDVTADIQANGSQDVDSSTIIDVTESAIDHTQAGLSLTANNEDDLHVPEASIPEVHRDVTGAENDIPDMEAEGQGQTLSDADDEDFAIDEPQIAPHLVDFAATYVEWDATSKVNPPFLLRGTLRPYQQSGLEWLASLHTNSLNGILADEMGLGKTIQTISLLAHLACDRGIWGPHLIVVPTSVLLNWEMEFKKFLPGFKILSYHGSTKRRKELRVGWNNKHSFNVCVTSYTLASRDAHIFKRKSWYYMVLDEAHMIKNFKSQRWNILLMFRSFRRLLLTGTPLQNNLTELWALLQFLMSGTNFANLKEFGDWFSNPLEKAIEQGTVLDEETQERVRKLHTVLRPYLLRRLKSDVEKELPSKYEHLVICRLSKRQRFLYDEFMSRAQTRDALASGVYHKVANILMQLRKVCNHPDLFEVRPIVTSFAMPRSATIDFEIKELLVRRRLMHSQEDTLNLDFLGLVFVQHQGKSMMQARGTRALDASSCLPLITELPGEPPPVSTRTIEGFKRHIKHQRQLTALRQWTQIAYTNRLRCAASPVYGSETISVIRSLDPSLVPVSEVDFRNPNYLDRCHLLPMLVKSHKQREEDLTGVIDRFAFVTPPAVARDMPSIALSGFESHILRAQNIVPGIDAILHRSSVKLQIAFPDASLIQYDCGKLQELASLLHKRKAGGHRVLIFTQMTKVLDILEIFLNFHGYRYLRLDGATKIEDRQYITERFNNDDRVFAFIASSRSGGVGINLTGADTVVFYDSDFNPQMDRQCEDRAHRIGQIRDVHIYRFISEHTVEESMLRKANQKRSLDNIVIQQGEFDWRSLLIDDEAFGKALGEFEDKEDAHAARVAAREEAVKEVEDRADFAAEADDVAAIDTPGDASLTTVPNEEESEEGGTIADYMLSFVKADWEFFSVWR